MYVLIIIFSLMFLLYAIVGRYVFNKIFSVLNDHLTIIKHNNKRIDHLEDKEKLNSKRHTLLKNRLELQERRLEALWSFYESLNKNNNLSAEVRSDFNSKLAQTEATVLGMREEMNKSILSINKVVAKINGLNKK